MLLLATSVVAAAGWPDVSAPAPVIGGGEKDAAVVVAVENYTFVAPVPGARINAAAWFDFFVKTRKTPLDRVQLLRDADAAAEGILEAAARAARDVTDGGAIWFVFIGHGAPAQDGKDGVLVGVDAQQRANSLYARSVPQKDLLDLLSRSRAAKIHVVLDACFSGRSPEGKPLVPSLQPLITAKIAPAVDARVVLLTAAGSDQFAGPLPGVARPAFSYLALGALRGWADSDRDGRITAGELHSYVAGGLRALLRDREQTPSLIGVSAVPLTSSARERGPDIGAMVKELADEAVVAPVSERGAARPARRMRVLVLISEVDRETPRQESVASKALQGQLREKGFVVVPAKSLGQERLAGIRKALKQGGAAAKGQWSGVADFVVWGEARTQAGHSGVGGLESCIAEISAELNSSARDSSMGQPSLEPVKGFGATMDRACVAAFKTAGAEWGEQIASLINRSY